MPITRLPQEIIDEVFNFLHEDKDTLRASSLVCHTWLVHARHQLFRQISLDPTPRSRRFMDLVARRPEIAELVRDLHLRGRGPPSHGWWEGTGSSSVILWPVIGNGVGRASRGSDRPDSIEVLSWLRETFSTLPRQSPLTAIPLHDALTPTVPSRGTFIPLPSASTAASRAPAETSSLPTPIFSRVHTLRLSEFALSPDTAAFLAAAFPRVTGLHLNSCRSKYFSGFVDLLQAFPTLRFLSLLSAEWLPDRNTPATTDAATPTVDNPLPKLTHLEVSRDVYVEPLINWLLKVSAHRSLCSLKCSIATRKSANALRALLLAAGPTLKHIHISLAESLDPTGMFLS